MLVTIAGLVSALAGLFTVALKYLQQRHDEQNGQLQQVASQTAQALSTQANITVAVVDAPRTQSAVVNSLNQGTF